MLKKLAKEIHDMAVNHGWWELDRSFGEVIALCHSELSEAFEEYRNGHEPTEMYYSSKDEVGKPVYSPLAGKPEGVPSELADCIIRILDYCEHVGIDIDEAIQIKMKYNESRPYRHGGKRA